MSAALAITHTSAEGTLLTGTVKGDGTRDFARSVGLRWGPSIGCWYLPHSRDRAPNRPKIDRLAEVLRAAGHEVDVDVDSTPRDRAEAEAEHAAHMAERAEHLAVKADRLEVQSDAHLAGARRVADGIPLGQPILVGHHSERRHRRDLARIDAGYRKGFEAHDEAKAAAAAAASSAGHTAARHNPVTVANRIEQLAADVRQAEGIRELWGATVERDERLAHLRNDLEHWRAVRALQIADGETPGYGPEDFAPGDQALYRGTWYEVRRVNRKSLTIPSIVGGSWTDTVVYAKVSGRRDAPAKEGATA